MSILSFFDRNKKSHSEKVIILNPSPEQVLFADTVLEVMSPLIEQFGFVRQRTEIETHLSTIVFRKDQQYIKIDGSTHPRDYPYFYNILLGEGDSEELLEWDWNSIPLWRLKNRLDPSANAMEYEFPWGNEIEASILKASEELLKYADSFLRGDLAVFYATRSEHNKSREPYKIHTTDEHGNYTIKDDPRSVDQKRKYS